MPISLPVATLIAGAASAGTSIYGAHQVAETQKAATSAQLGYDEKALDASKEKQDYDRAQYGSYLERLKPYADIAGPSIANLNSLLGRPGVSPGAPSPTAAAGWPTPTAAGTVKMRAPSGEIEDVPAGMVAHYEQLGAVKVQGAGA